MGFEGCTKFAWVRQTVAMEEIKALSYSFLHH
jgi:hypothetical protein